MAVQWTFPKRFFIKIEMYTLFLIAVLVFLLTLFQLHDLAYALLATALFVVLYLILAYMMQTIRRVEEKYHLHTKHLHIVRKSRNLKVEETILLREIKRHKLDHFFLGGYILTKKGRKHLLFFNHPRELKRFEEMLTKYLKRK